MKAKSSRLFFIDVIRAWAILMMLQGHFIDGLLDVSYRDPNNLIYKIWLYFRGITAPVFFTVSGFIFTYLLIRVEKVRIKNPRVEKGVKRGLQLLFIGYLLRSNLFGLLKGEVYNTFFLVDVLHCIGLSLLGIIAIYLLTQRVKKLWFALILIVITTVLFMFEPLYSSFSYTGIPQPLANYFTREHGSIFTIIPWFGYASFGAFMATLFHKFKDAKHLYMAAIIGSLVIGIGLIFYSSPLFMLLSNMTGVSLFKAIYFNNYLFIRLGDVLIAFALFMVLRNLITHKTVLKIGQNTLSIYVIHFVILYGSLTGMGLYRYYHHTLSPEVAISGAIGFMIASTFLALQYDKYSTVIQLNIGTLKRFLIVKLDFLFLHIVRLGRSYFFKLRLMILKLFRLAKN